MPTLTFTDGPDTYVSSGSANPHDPLITNFLAGNDSLRTVAGYTQGYMGDGDDYARVDSTSLAIIFGEAGNDRIDVYGNSTRVDGGDGDDVINVFAGGVGTKLNL